MQHTHKTGITIVKVQLSMACWCRYFAEQGFEHVVLLSADGALEAAPAMGAADIILDLVSTGVTLRENNLKEVQGGHILEVRTRGKAQVTEGRCEHSLLLISLPFHVSCREGWTVRRAGYASLHNKTLPFSKKLRG
jgi:ATP phosphoribosyltransferase